MKKIIFLLLAVWVFNYSNAQIQIPRQEIHYNVNYHWGFLDVMIAKGVVTIQNDNNGFYGTLDGTSIPWEGHIICVSDTLRADFSGTAGAIKEKVNYQNGWYRHPAVSSFNSSTYNPEDPAIFKSIAGQGAYDASSDSMEAIAVTSDMIGMYYLAQALDFSKMQPGDKLTVPIEGPYSKEVVITYQGPGSYQGNDGFYRTYDLTFEYGYHGNLSGFPVICKVGAADKIPLYLQANLPVGRVEMLYDSHN